ncbi:MAG: hypothetical protein PUG74_02360 [Prevotellaceae bacterium]|nr:hypothetical protein [Prevotellaceae bacterium]
MKVFTKVLGAVMALGVTLTLLGTFMHAAARDCTFWHGMDGKYGYGSTESTQVESSLKNVITVSFYDNNESYSKTAASGNSSYCIVKTNYLGGKKGRHSCTYYVNGEWAHTSTKAWPFDFSGDWW